jgi:eukaryotic-like serine/threonine-protein kinase
LRQPIPFGKYYLLERINVGGMAEVFKAKATGVEGFERLVAVKRILPSIAEDEEFITMFVDEAKIAVQLTHANIGQIFDLGRVEGSYFIALEYVHGKDMRAIFNRARQRAEFLPIPLSCYVIMKLCEGLDYAHNKHDGSGTFLNLVHRDVSPQNILVSYEGEVKIIDFGIAKAVGKSGRTQAGILKGKFGYMSPEQVEGLEIDRRSDVFGVGICLYELLTGERLFTAETDFATLEKVRSADFPPPSSANARIPEELEQIVMRSLARDREVRYQTALQLHDDLQSFMRTSTATFSRKDLSSYMHRVFAEEIAKETARDQEYAQMDPSAGASDGRGLGAFDGLAPVNTVSKLTPPLPLMSSHPMASIPAPRLRKATLLGIPQSSGRAEGLRVPSVPRLVPGPNSVPPPSHSRPPLLSRQSFPPAGQPPSAGMEWDDEELSTQIYDKPDEALAALQVSLPEETHQVMPAPKKATGLQTAAGAVGAVGEPWRTGLQTGQGRAVSFSGGPTSGRAQAQTLSLDRQPNKARPLVVAVVAVVAIVACIVLGLLLFGQREAGTVNLTATPNRVEVTVDGRSLGSSTSPFVIGELSPGVRHDIVVSSPGYKPWTRAVQLESGQVLSISDVRLAPVETGFMLDSAPNGAGVFVDERRLPQNTPVHVSDMTPGDHRIRVELPGYAPWESLLHATPGTVLPLPLVSLQPLAAEPPAAEPPVASAPPTSSKPWQHHAASAQATTGATTEAETEAAPDAPEPASSSSASESSEAKSPEVAEKAPAEHAATTEKGKLRVNTRPWSQVFIDGKPYGSTPRLNIELSVGAHTLTLVNEEFSVKKTVEVTIKAGTVENVVLDLLE